jgi:proteasome lid subunit RPN8/RPN11
LRVQLPSILANQLYAHARADFPNECCGLMIGKISADTVDISEIHPSENLTSHSPSKIFEVDPKLRFDLMRATQSRNDGTDIVGHYHSHPNGPAEPSATDLSMAYEPQMIWLICGLDKKNNTSLCAFRPFADRSAFETLELVIESA